MEAHAPSAPDVERLVHAARDLDEQRMTVAERLAEAVVGGFAVLAALVVLAVGDVGDVDVLALIVLALAYALAGRVRFEVGFGVTDPSLLVVVPMLFVLPAPIVPLVVVVMEVLGRLPEHLAGTVHPERALKGPANAWYAIALAAVLTVGVDGGPRWSDWPWYLAAFAAMVAVDASAGTVREALASKVAPEVQLRVFVPIYALDALLFPVGLLAAFATAQADYAFLLLVPLVGVLGGAAREREQRLSQALELAESRAEVLGAISHALQTPLSVVVGLSDALHRRAEGAESADAELIGRLRAEAHWLRIAVDQTLDYQRLHAGWPLRLRAEAVDVETKVHAAVELCSGPPAVALDVAEELPRAQADGRRVMQIVHGLLANARRFGPPEVPIVVTLRADGPDVVVEVHDDGPGVDPGARGALFAEPTGARGTDESQGTGITLYVSRALAEAMGGGLDAAFGPGGGSTFSLRLPAVGH